MFEFEEVHTIIFEFRTGALYLHFGRIIATLQKIFRLNNTGFCNKNRSHKFFRIFAERNSLEFYVTNLFEYNSGVNNIAKHRQIRLKLDNST